MSAGIVKPEPTEAVTRTHEKKTRDRDPSIQDLIQRGRTEKPKARGSWLLAGLSGFLLWASFPPLEWAPLAWVALVPLLMLVRLPQRPRWMYVAISLSSAVSFLAMIQWMRFGDPTMYPAWIALALYCSIYLPIFVASTRIAVHRFGIPLLLAAPVAWVGLELLRGRLMTGFPWYFLGHTQYRWLEVIQISDLVGSHGVSFLIVLASVTVALLISNSLFSRLGLLVQNATPVGDSSRTRWIAAGVSVLCFAMALGYGYFRRAEYRENLANSEPGPKVALIQGNFPTSVNSDPNSRGKILYQHHWLTGQAVKHQPDLIVWPETMYRSELLLAPEEMSDEDLTRLAPYIPVKYWRENMVSASLADMSKMANAGLVIGVDTLIASPGRVIHYNSAAFVTPEDQLVKARYDKMHRVPFGEYIPLRDQIPWLHQLTPFSDSFGIAKGEGVVAFQYGEWNLIPLICYEDTIPQLVRGMIASEESGENGKPVDVLVNLTNDGWFHPKSKTDRIAGSSASEQHLITAAFRSVECRRPMVRAVNTGISAFISGEGEILEPELLHDADEEAAKSMRDPKTGRWHEEFNAILVSTVPLDGRASLYLRWGDWFAWLCSYATLGVLVVAMVSSLMNRFRPVTLSGSTPKE